MRKLPEKILTPCPFCGGDAEIAVCDDEGNLKDDDYLFDPWGGLGFLILHDSDKNPDCPIAHFSEETLGTKIYDYPQDAARSWNTRIIKAGGSQ